MCENHLPLYINIENIYLFTFIKNCLQYSINSSEFDYFKSYILDLTKHNCIKGGEPLLTIISLNVF